MAGVSKEFLNKVSSINVVDIEETSPATLTEHTICNKMHDLL